MRASLTVLALTCLAASAGLDAALIPPAQATEARAATAMAHPHVAPPGPVARCGHEIPLPAVSYPRSVGPAHGHLLMVGGGGTTPAMNAEAARLAGGAHARWVVIPTASDDSQIPILRTDNSVTPLHQPFVIMHTRDRAVADSKAFVAPLLTATAVWFEGGRQSRLVDAYAGTRTERALRALLDRGGLIAGTSAGASIQASRLVRAGGHGTIMTSARYHDGFDYVTHLAVDQHINTRHRETDLKALVAVSPGLLGLGLDEQTGVIISGEVARVIGAGRVLVTDGYDHGGSPYWCMRAGQALNLASWTSLHRPVR